MKQRFYLDAIQPLANSKEFGVSIAAKVNKETLNHLIEKADNDDKSIDLEI